MVRVGVHTSVASANVSSEIQPQFHETVYAAAAATISTQTHPLERHPSSQNGSVRNAAEVWKGQLTKSLSRRKDLLNPPVHDNVVVVTPAMLRAMPVRARMRFVLTRPEESRLGWCVHHLILVIVSIDVFLVLTLRTLDGPRFSRGTDPAYPYLPTQKQFDIAEKLFSTVYTFEFVLRWATASSQRKYWKSMQTWVALLALLPVFVSQAGMSTADDPDGDDALASRFAISLRFVRILRLPLMSKVHVGSKVMFEAISKSLAPLRITVKLIVCAYVWETVCSTDRLCHLYWWHVVRSAVLFDRGRDGVRDGRVLRRALLRPPRVLVHGHFQRRLLRHGHVSTQAQVIC